MVSAAPARSVRSFTSLTAELSRSIRSLAAQFHAPDCCTYLNPRIIRAPSNERNLAPLSLPRRQIIVKVVDSVSRALGHGTRLGLGLCVDELLAEGVPVSVLRGVLDDDGLVVVGKGVDDVFDRLAQLQLVELGDALGCDLNSVGGVSVYGFGCWEVLGVVSWQQAAARWYGLRGKHGGTDPD